MFFFDQYRDNDKHIMWGMKLINVWDGRGCIRRNMYKWRWVDGLAVFIVPSLHIVIYRYVLNNSACWARFFISGAFFVGFFLFLWFVLFNFYPSKSVHTRYGNVAARKTLLTCLSESISFYLDASLCSFKN